VTPRAATVHRRFIGVSGTTASWLVADEAIIAGQVDRR
jgi:hypothetical protein